MNVFAILAQIQGERVRQVKKWGAQRHPDGTDPAQYGKLLERTRERCEAERAQMVGVGPTWAAIMLEEVMEAFCETDPAKLRAELIQVAAVAAAWVQDIDTRSPLV